jgi:hypothetical protein
LVSQDLAFFLDVDLIYRFRHVCGYPNPDRC